MRFSLFSCLLASTGWRKTNLISVLFIGPRPSVLNRAGLASVAATEPVCWASKRWVRAVCRPWLNRAGLHLLEVMCCYRAGDHGMSSFLDFARSRARDMPISKRRCDEIVKLGSHEQFLSLPLPTSLQRKEKPWVRKRACLSYVPDISNANYILTCMISCLVLREDTP